TEWSTSITIDVSTSSMPLRSKPGSGMSGESRGPSTSTSNPAPRPRSAPPGARRSATAGSFCRNPRRSGADTSDPWLRTSTVGSATASSSAPMGSPSWFPRSNRLRRWRGSVTTARRRTASWRFRCSSSEAGSVGPIGEPCAGAAEVGVRMADVTFPRIGVIGGGQLARMLAPAAEALGIRFSVLAETADAPATQVINEVSVGDYTDYPTLKAFAETVDVITFDHEHVPPEHLRALVEAGHVVRPGPQALIFAQDKIRMRTKMDELGLPNPAWAEITSAADVEAFAARVGYPFILKTPRGGYGGKGVRVIDSLDEAVVWLREVPQLLAEEKVDFTRELAVMVGRSPMGQTAVWPVVETWQQNGVCKEAIAPAPGLETTKAKEITEAILKVAGTLDVTGVMAMEMCETADGFLINEFAMRPHNTGHWTQDGSVTSQFEQHLRAVLDLPLGSPAAREDVSVMVNVL